MTYAGQPVVLWDHTAADSRGQRDDNLDGFAEWQAFVQRAATEIRTEVLELSPQTQRPVRRSIYQLTGQDVLVTIEKADASGTLQPVESFSTGPDDFFHRGEASGPIPDVISSQLRGSVLVNCTQSQQNQARGQIRHGMDVGLNCLRHHKANDLILDMMFHYVARDLKILCAKDLRSPSGRKFTGQLDYRSFLDITRAVEITVDVDDFFALGDVEQARLMWHEMLHNEFGGHHPKTFDWERYEELDRVEACEGLCFGFGTITQCSCAQCLGTNKCDERCKPYSECDSRLEFTCPCPQGKNAGRKFARCQECLAECPSGIACSGYHTCKVTQSVACEGEPATCP